MGASNFYTKNANRLYPLFTDTPEDEQYFFDYDFEVECIIEELNSLNNKYDSQDINESKGYDRNYPERILIELNQSRTFGDVEIEVITEVIIRSGYYEGSNLDYETKFQDQNSYDNFEDANDIEINSYNSDMNTGLCAIQVKNAQEWANQARHDVEEYLENIFAKITQPYVMIARASNGETFYKKA